MPALSTIIKYAVSLLIAGVLLWYVYKDLDAATMLAKVKEADYRWIILAVLISLFGHTLRAYRWNLLLKPLGYRSLTVFRTLLAVMVGYFANLIIPRMGEVSRCGLLNRTDQVPITTSLGSVVAERLVDLCCLMLCTALLLVVEFNKLKGFFFAFFDNTLAMVGRHLHILYGLAALVLLGLLLFLLAGNMIREKFRHNRSWHKLRSFAREVVAGISSVASIENPWGFWLSTALIWVIYFLMSYVVFFALPETSGLGWRAGMAVLVMGSLGMTAPVQGGIGTFHALVGSVLLLYGVPEADGVLFATMTHGMQTLTFVIFGAVSFFLAGIIASRRPVASNEWQANT